MIWDVTVARTVRTPMLICVLALAGCSGGKGSTSAPLSVTTTSLPNGQVHHAMQALSQLSYGPT